MCTSIETGRFIDEEQQGLTDYIWYYSLSSDSHLLFCSRLDIQTVSQSSIKSLVAEVQEIVGFDYGYCFEMGMESGPTFYASGGTLNGRKHFTQLQIEEIAKWSHARGECRKLGLPVSHLLRDVFPLNFVNPRHLSMQIGGQSLKDWIEADPRRGTLAPLIEERLWTWTVPENRIAAIRKVLGPARLLVSWGDFDTPSGGPLGHTYGAKGKDTPPPFPGLPLTDAERRWVDEGLAAMRPLFERYTAQKPSDFEHLMGRREALLPKLLDLAFTAWSEDASPDRASPEQALQAFAAALGEHLVRRHRMAWYAVEDAHGRSLGVCHRGKGGAQTWAHPVDSVAKRIDAGETGFIAGVVEAVGEQISRGG